MCILVLSPFGTAHRLISAWRTRGMRVNLAVAGIDHQPFVVRFVDQNLQSLFPDPCIAPANEATVRIPPSAMVRW